MLHTISQIYIFYASSMLYTIILLMSTETIGSALSLVPVHHRRRDTVADNNAYEGKAGTDILIR